MIDFVWEVFLILATLFSFVYGFSSSVNADKTATRNSKLEAQLEKYKTALESIVGQTDDQFVGGVWREVNSTALEALQEKGDE